MTNTEFKPRKFRAKQDLFGLSDGGVASFTFRAQYLEKDKVYFEANPAYIQGREHGVVIDDDANWHHVGRGRFDELFEEIV